MDVMFVWESSREDGSYRSEMNVFGVSKKVISLSASQLPDVRRLHRVV
jgi:hypothetical protein